MRPVRKIPVNVSYDEAETLATQLADKQYGTPVTPVTPTQPQAPLEQATVEVEPTKVAGKSKRKNVIRSVSMPEELDEKLERYVLQNRLNKAEKHRSISSVITDLLENFLAKVP